MENDNANIINRCHFLVTCIGIVTILVALSVIIGSYYHVTLLTSISPNWVNMKLNAAVGFLLAGLALLMINKKKPRCIYPIFFCVVSVLLLIINIMTLVQYLFGVDFGIDQLIMQDIGPLFPATVSPGRMAPIAAINFMLMAIVFLLLLKKSTSAWVIQTLVWFVLLIAFISFCNYLYLTDASYMLVKYTTMAINSSLLFLLVGTGVLLLKPTEGMIGILLRKSTGGYLLRYLIPILVVVPISIDMVTHYLQRWDLLDPNFGDSMMAIGTIVIVGFFVLITAKIIDRNEKDIVIVETEIQRNQMIFHQLAENVDVVFCTASPDFNKILYVSPAYEKVWGRSIESLYKNPKDWFNAVLPEDQSIVYEDVFIKAQKETASISNEFRIKKPDGSIRHLFGRIKQLKDEKNNPYCIIGVIVDITYIKTEKKYKELQHDVFNLIENEKNIESFSPQFLKLMCRALDFDLGALWLMDKSKNSMRCVDIWHIKNQQLYDFDLKIRRYTFSIDEGFLGEVWKNKSSLFAPHYSENKNYIRSADAKIAGICSAIGVPVVYRDQIFGVLEFFSFNVRDVDSELLLVMESIGKSIGELVERFNTDEKVKELARHDLLTGLLNRSALEEDLNEFIKQNKLASIAVMLLDVDRFKLINETFGHAHGDMILKSLATRFALLNINKKMKLSRLGADKFIFYFPGINKKDAYGIAQMIHLQLGELFEIEKNKITLLASIGIALYPQDGLNANKLIVNAELAVSGAKFQGGNRIYFFETELALAASKTMTMDIDLRQAIQENQFLLLYQPQINLATETVCCAEALVRWRHPTKGLILPGEFIFFAEENNLIVPINEKVLRMLFQQISAYRLNKPVSVNISAAQFKDGFHLAEYLKSLLNEFSIDPRQIQLEITENMLMEDTEHNIAVLTAIRELGFQIALDDFGAGFSSFGYLKRLPVQKIKIDKTFIAGLPGNTANAEIVKAIIAMAHAFNKIVVAEGAETQAEVDFLKQEKCDVIQGFYYYKPMEFDELAALLKR